MVLAGGLPSVRRRDGEGKDVAIRVEDVTDLFAPGSNPDPVEQPPAVFGGALQRGRGVGAAEIQFASLAAAGADLSREQRFDIGPRHQSQRGPAHVELRHALHVQGGSGVQDALVEGPSTTLFCDVQDEFRRMHGLTMPLLKIRLYPADSEVPTFANGQTPHRAAERADARTCGIRCFGAAASRVEARMARLASAALRVDGRLAGGVLRCALPGRFRGLVAAAAQS
jgi:hypothetical protein